jgi:hypothetical protein
MKPLFLTLATIVAPFLFVYLIWLVSGLYFNPVTDVFYAESSMSAAFWSGTVLYWMGLIIWGAIDDIWKTKSE